MSLEFVPLDQIDPNPFQVRLQEDAAVVAEIAASIGKMGLMQVPTARKVGERYQLAFGHTRLAAFKQLANDAALAGAGGSWGEMPLMVRELSDLEMFELAVAENIKRRDLNPIETARAMKTYMETFGKTSEEAGEFFGVSAETVRGKVRLLGLPAPVQKKIESKELSEADGRKLLSLQRIDPKEAAAIGKKAGPAMAGTIDDAVEERFRKNKAVVEMWARFRDDEGKARGGDDLWPLDWKHSGMAPLTDADMFTLLGIPKGALLDDVVSEQVERLWNAIRAGMAVDADQFPGLPVDQVQLLLHLADPPPCTSCTLHVVLDGAHYCGERRCWERKKTAWLNGELQTLSKKLGIAVYDPTSDPKPAETYDTTYDENRNRSWLNRINKKEPSLRLAVRGNHWNGYPKTKHHLIAIVDVSGEAKKRVQQRRAATRQGSSNDDWNSPENVAKRQRAEQLRRAGEQLIETVYPIFGQAFEPLKNIAAMEALVYEKTKPSLPKAKRLEILHRSLAERALEDVVPYGLDDQGPVVIARFFEKLAVTWGVKLPKDWMERAKGMMPKEEKAAPKKKANPVASRRGAPDARSKLARAGKGA